jgi:hypothetical protein
VTGKRGQWWWSRDGAGGVTDRLASPVPKLGGELGGVASTATIEDVEAAAAAGLAVGSGTGGRRLSHGWMTGEAGEVAHGRVRKKHAMTRRAQRAGNEHGEHRRREKGSPPSRDRSRDRGSKRFSLAHIFFCKS